MHPAFRIRSLLIGVYRPTSYHSLSRTNESVCNNYLKYNIGNEHLYILLTRTHQHTDIQGPVSYIGKSVGLCASVKESMRNAVRFTVAADFRDSNLGLARSFARGP